MKQWETSELYREVKSRPSEDGSLPFQKDSEGFNTEARRRCLHLLEYSPRTAYQLKKRLMDDGFSADRQMMLFVTPKALDMWMMEIMLWNMFGLAVRKRAGVSFICSFQAAVWIRNQLKMHLRPMQMNRKIRCASGTKASYAKAASHRRRFFKGSKKSCIKGISVRNGKTCCLGTA